MTGAAMPVDVRLMNGVSSAVYLIAGAALLVVALVWLARSSAFPIRAIRLEGDLQRNSVSTVRANALPGLSGNFYSLDLRRTRAAFESVPWVRHAVVRRHWPDRLSVRLEEHRAVALWQGEDGNERLVNSFGEVFVANVGDVEDEGLPQLAGPEGTSAEMLQMLQRLQPVLARLDREIVALSLTGRGSWRVELDGETVVELGRGRAEEIAARTERFVRTLSQVTGHFRSPLVAADLRYPEGYAVRLRGVTTVTPATAAQGSQ